MLTFPCFLQVRAEKPLFSSNPELDNLVRLAASWLSPAWARTLARKPPLRPGALGSLSRALFEAPELQGGRGPLRAPARAMGVRGGLDVGASGAREAASGDAAARARERGTSPRSRPREGGCEK